MTRLSASLAMTQVRELLKAGHTVTIPVQGKSMWPFLSGNGTKRLSLPLSISLSTMPYSSNSLQGCLSSIVS